MKQHLAAVRMLFDYLVVGQVVEMKPATAGRGPSYSNKKRETPVLDEDEARRLIDGIDTDSLLGLRDRAIIAGISDNSMAITIPPSSQFVGSRGTILTVVARTPAPIIGLK